MPQPQQLICVGTFCPCSAALTDVVSIRIAGRVYSKRVQGKLVFYDLKADGKKVQVMADASTSCEELHAFVTLHNSVKIGDIIGVTGFPGACRCPPHGSCTMMLNYVSDTC